MPRILLVEDEEHLAKGIRFNLELDGYEVETIGGRPARARAAGPRADGAAAAVIDLVVLDVMLPGLDGFAVVRAHARRPATTRRC